MKRTFWVITMAVVAVTGCKTTDTNNKPTEAVAATPASARPDSAGGDAQEDQIIILSELYRCSESAAYKRVCLDLAREAYMERSMMLTPVLGHSLFIELCEGGDPLACVEYYHVVDTDLSLRGEDATEYPATGLDRMGMRVVQRELYEKVKPALSISCDREGQERECVEWFALNMTHHYHSVSAPALSENELLREIAPDVDAICREGGEAAMSACAHIAAYMTVTLQPDEQRDDRQARARRLQDDICEGSSVSELDYPFSCWASPEIPGTIEKRQAAMLERCEAGDPVACHLYVQAMRLPIDVALSQALSGDLYEMLVGAAPPTDPATFDEAIAALPEEKRQFAKEWLASRQLAISEAAPYTSPWLASFKPGCVGQAQPIVCDGWARACAEHEGAPECEGTPWVLKK